jgi:protease IV
MTKRPFRTALLVLGAIFLLFVAGALALSGISAGGVLFSFKPKVGVVEVVGAIDSSRQIIEDLNAFKNDRSIRAVVLRIDSPGGGVGPSQEIYEEVRKLTEVKPVVVSMGSVAASGGYYIAAPAKRILANPGTITGSIGVIMQVANIQELLEKIGFRSQVLKSGDHKDIGSIVRPMSDEDRLILQGVIDDVHTQFIQAIADGRGMSAEEVEIIADGRIFTGRQALEAGLVDELGNLQDSIKIAADLAGVVGEFEIIYPPRRRPGLLSYLIGDIANQLHQSLQERAGSGLQFIWSGVH